MGEREHELTVPFLSGKTICRIHDNTHSEKLQQFFEAPLKRDCCQESCFEVCSQSNLLIIDADVVK